MVFRTFEYGMFLLLAVAFAMVNMATAGDPDIISDIILPQNVTSVDGNFFTYTAMRSLVEAPSVKNFTVLKASMNEFPALNGQSVSYAVLRFPGSSINPPHIHPRSAELLFLLYGFLEVGFVDTKNKLYTQKMQAGDMFVFPKGVVHFQNNLYSDESALAVSAFGSANAGTVSIPGSVFTTGIGDVILAKAFKTDVTTIQKIKAGLTPKV
ncbi:hypothetical protein IFM89_031001 [Coptis chinensis]|uniref:Germin-like protein n=1 Tax=Coptis chinensis TaxID=261450 RepID=A0A835LJZ4_9MAGN|nr:hypothetical protein IFM89_031001 [Coptis chinensis]